MTDSTTFFCRQALPSLVDDIICHRRRKTLKESLIHLGNADPHNSEQSQDYLEATKAQWLTHPPYRPDRAPTNFFSFGYIKGKLPDFQCDPRED
jgi:hypothetical protein